MSAQAAAPLPAPNVIFDHGEQQDLAEPKPPDLVFQQRGRRPSLSRRRRQNLSLNLVTQHEEGYSSSTLSSPDSYPSSPITPLLEPFIKSHPSLRSVLPTSTTPPPTVAAPPSTILQPTTRLDEQSGDADTKGSGPSPLVSHVRDYVIIGDITVAGVTMLPALNTRSGCRYRCKVIDKKDYPEQLRASYLMDTSEFIAHSSDIIRDECRNTVLAFFPTAHSDLQTFMQEKKSLKESEAKTVFRQIITAVADCHESGVVVRDLKMKKIIVTDLDSLEVKLDCIDNAKILTCDDDDLISERTGCPAYVSPEMLKPSPTIYSAKKADMWSVGVVLYGLLVGRYPFYDKDPIRMLAKIYRGKYHVPSRMSGLAKSLVASLLSSTPDRRPSPEEVLRHPWFKINTDECVSEVSARRPHAHPSLRHQPYPQASAKPQQHRPCDDHVVPSVDFSLPPGIY